MAQAAKVPQIKVPWGCTSACGRSSTSSFSAAVRPLALLALDGRAAAEVEPFKTAIALRFLRDWPFVVFAGDCWASASSSSASSAAISARSARRWRSRRASHVFDWLKRTANAASPCQRCAKECPVQCIHPEGTSTPTSASSACTARMLYWDDHQCPSMIQRRLKREKREALTRPRCGAGRAAPRAQGRPRPPTADPSMNRRRNEDVGSDRSKSMA